MALAAVFLDSSYNLLMVLHLLATFALVGAMTHNLIIVIGYVRGKFGRKNREQYYVKIAFWSYIIVYAFGALAYPAFRINTRAALFDLHIRWATGLFEVKEHWGGLGLALIGVYYFLRRHFEPDQEKEKLYFYVPLCFLLNIILWYKVIVGCYLALLKGAGQ